MTIQSTRVDTDTSPSPPRSPPGDATGDVIATGLGLFSVGLGLAELLLPRTVARSVGVEQSLPNLTVLRAAGLRELSSGLGLLGGGNQTGWLRARVGGDVMDLALLGAAFASPKAKRPRLTTAVGAVLGVTALDVLSSQRASQLERGRRPEHAVSARVHDAGLAVRRAITINRPLEEVYAFWRDFRGFPRFMRHLESVEELSARRYRWRMRGPAGTTLTWETDILIDQPDERIAWRSAPGSELESAGDVRFMRAPGGRGTEVHIALHYSPPGGALGRALAKLAEALPKHEIEADLRASKQLLEVGEIVQSDVSRHRLPHPAKPAKPSLEGGPP
jgi:uncharacterized membrane protein